MPLPNVSLTDNSQGRFVGLITLYLKENADSKYNPIGVS